MKIAIAGYGAEGEQNYLYYSKDPNNQILIADQKQEPDRPLPDGAETILGEDAFTKLQDFDLVIRTASLPPKNIKTNGKIWSATNEFFANCPATIIGVTGSKGKGTTSSLIASILEEAGKKVWLVGNIGNSALAILDQIQKDDVVVYELSSFQLWDIEYSPHIAVVLFIEQEHLDVHSSIQDYIGAKTRIVSYQTGDDLLIYHKDNKYAQSIADVSVATKIAYPDTSTAHIKDDFFYYGDKQICSVQSLKIKGVHNQKNACAAIDAVWSVGVQEPSIIEKGLSSFKGLPHRLQLVQESDGISYYDDSIATTPNSAIAALRAFNEPKVIILGGSSKGSDFSELAQELVNQDAKAILIGDEANNIAEACDRAGFADYEILQDASMGDIVRRAKSLLNSGVVLLSPACASFGMFKNYEDRGDQFTLAVRAL